MKEIEPISTLQPRGAFAVTFVTSCGRREAMFHFSSFSNACRFMYSNYTPEEIKSAGVDVYYCNSKGELEPV